jgi:hypothetical protein
MTDASCESRATLGRLSVWYAVAFISLVIFTDSLWLGSSEFPEAPAVTWLTRVPRSVDLALLIGFAAATLIGAAATRRWHPFWIAATAYVAASFCLNQHRLQIWAYHLCIAGLLTEFSARGRAIPRLRWLTISIYVWSALSKLDSGFAAGAGRSLLHGLTSALSIHPPAGAIGQHGPWLMPIGELLTGVALAVPRWRRIGLWMSIAMHLLLLLAVGPFGLRHELGVQIWNGVFLIQNVILFGRSKPTGVPGADVPVVPRSPWIDHSMKGLLAIVIVMPALQPWGYWDIWPSWAVYSARGGWTTSFVHHEDVEKLPPTARRFVGEPPPLSDWHPIDIDAWSLRELHCPVYPQSRFRLAVAAALSRSARIRVERRSPPDRFGGAATTETIDIAGGRLPPEVAAQFWLNTTPRAVSEK